MIIGINFFEKFNKYTSAAANKYKAQGKSCSFLGDILLRPTWAFFKIYILQGGILDGENRISIIDLSYDVHYDEICKIILFK